MPKRRTLAQQIAALKPGRQTIEAERDELRRIKDGAITAAEARRRAAAWRTAGDEQMAHGQMKIKISAPLIKYAERLDALKRMHPLALTLSAQNNAPGAAAHGARDIITATAAVLAHEGGYQRALDVLELIRRLHDPRSPNHRQRTRRVL
jgi:hypothetical protein